MQKKKQIAKLGDSKKRTTENENELFELRVDLNYILVRFTQSFYMCLN